MLSLLLLAAVANAVPIEDLNAGGECAYGAWSPWSECTVSKHCPAVPLSLKTHKMEATSEWDEGRSAMMKLMRDKRESWAARDACIADGSCAETFKMPLNGAYECIDGLAGDMPCFNVDQLSFLTFAQMGYTTGTPRGNDVWGWTDPQNGDEYAIMGFNGGTSFVRITDPKNPVPVGFMYSTGNTVSSWRDIKVIGNYAFIVSEAANHGLQVMDLTRLRGRMTIAYFTPDAVNNDFGQAHNIACNEETNYCYVVGARSGAYPRLCAGGLLVLDVSNPLQPTYAGCFGGDGYVHDTQCVIYHGADSRYVGREICFCFNENSFTIVDATNKAAMTMITKSGYPNVAYTHQGWATEDHLVVLMDDEQDEAGKPADQQFTKTYVWDVRDLTNPTLMSIFQSSERSIDHNQYIIGDLAYQGNYESGLRILNINRATYQLQNVGWFDVLPSRTTAQYNGAWSVYPWFKSGSIAISSIDYGLFIVKANMAAIRELIDSGATPAQQTRTRTSTGSMCPKVLETKSCPAQVLC
jgi:choice-of-anchor B domain-containing protein